MVGASRELAWVESPLQLLAAAEYAASRGTAIDVALRVGPQMAETAQRLLDRRALFSSVAPYFGIPWGLLGTRRSWLIGDGFSGQFHTALSALGARRVTLLDDGMMTIPLARAIDGEREFRRPGRAESRHRAVLASLAHDRLLALAARESLSFFTSFAAHDAVGRMRDRGIGIAENDFAWLRAAGAPLALPGDTVVLGAAAVADGRVEPARYLDWVRAAVEDTGPAVYLPHRRETAPMLAAVSRIPNLTVVRTGLPVELALAGTARPLQIRTLPSTAAITLGLVLEGTGSTIRTEHVREPVS